VNPDFPAQTPQFQAMTFADAQHGWAVGHNGVIYGTSSGGLVHADAPPAPTTMSMTVLPSPLRQQQQGDLRLELPNTQSVRITLYNVLGQRIRIVYDGTLSAGTNHLSLDTADPGQHTAADQPSRHSLRITRISISNRCLCDTGAKCWVSVAEFRTTIPDALKQREKNVIWENESNCFIVFQEIVS
jgi:hypothetical protein